MKVDLHVFCEHATFMTVNFYNGGTMALTVVPLPARRRAGGHDSHRPASFPATQGASMNRTTHTRSHTLTLTSAMAKSG